MRTFTVDAKKAPPFVVFWRAVSISDSRRLTLLLCNTICTMSTSTSSFNAWPSGEQKAIIYQSGQANPFVITGLNSITANMLLRV